MSSQQAKYWALITQNGATVATLELTAGNITQDFNASARRTCQVDFTAWGSFSGSGSIVPEVVPGGTDQRWGDLNFGDNVFGDSTYESLRGLIVPLLSEMKIYGSFSTDGGPVTQKLLGVFTLGDPTWTVTDSGVTVSVAGWDAGGDIAATVFDRAIYIFPIDTVNVAMETCLDPYVPVGVSVNIPTLWQTVGESFYVPGSGTNPWHTAQEYADIAGWQLYVTRDGSSITVANQPAPGSYDPPSYYFDDRTNIISVSLATSSREICNTVIVSGDAIGGDATWAKAEDLNGPYGVVTTGKRIAREFSSDKVKTQAECQYLANTYLRKWSRTGQKVEVTCLPIPDLEVGQTVSVRSQSLDLSVGEVFFVERVEFPLDPTAPMTFTASRVLL